MDKEAANWPTEIFNVLKARNIKQVCHVPDAGHDQLIRLCTAHNDMAVTTLTTEEEGVGIVAGAWLGGQRGVLLMQSSGVGNTINALAMPATCRIPFLTIVTMRGEWGEGNPWQVPMGQGAPGALEAMGVTLFRVDRAEDMTDTVNAAAGQAFSNQCAAAVLISQRVIGAKGFE